MAICLKCDTYVSSDDNGICPKCGHNEKNNLVNSSKNSSTGTKDNQKQINLNTYLIIGISLIAFLIYFSLYTHPGKFLFNSQYRECVNTIEKETVFTKKVCKLID